MHLLMLGADLPAPETKVLCCFSRPPVSSAVLPGCLCPGPRGSQSSAQRRLGRADEPAAARATHRAWGFRGPSLAYTGAGDDDHVPLRSVSGTLLKDWADREQKTVLFEESQQLICKSAKD